ncbi:MAG: metallophosphoesterase, partial [Clostridiaceae bacterium]|nr:metallophosphoesterase [Clostridiaceae bacterium]
EFGMEYSKHLYKIKLTGELPVNLKPSSQAISVWMSHALFFYKIIDKTTVTANIEELSHEISLKGTFIRKILEKINDCKNKSDFDLAERYRMALNIGLRAFEGEVKYDENN